MRLVIAWLIVLASVPAFADTLVVGNKVDDTLSFIDLATGEEVRRIASGRWPHELALSPDGGTVVAVSYRDETDVGHSLDVFDVANAEKRKTIDLLPAVAPHGIAWLPDTESVVVVTQRPVNVLKVDIARGEVTDTLATGEDDPHLIAMTSDGSRIYVTNRGSDTISVVDTGSFALVATLKGGKGTEAIALSPDDAELWVGNRTAQTIMVFDVASGSVTRELEFDFDPVRLAISPDGSLVAVADYSNARLLTYDIASGANQSVVDLAAEAGIEEPAHLGFTPDGGTLFVSGQKAGVVAEIDAADWSVRRILPAAAGADGLALSPVEIVR
jgi:YVTN family beta-propeller protein